MQIVANSRELSRNLQHLHTKVSPKLRQSQILTYTSCKLTNLLHATSRHWSPLHWFLQLLIKFFTNSSKLSSYIYAKKAGPNLYCKHCIVIKNVISKKLSKSFALRITSHPSSSRKYTPAAWFSNIFHAFISFISRSFHVHLRWPFGIMGVHTPAAKFHRHTLC